MIVNTSIDVDGGITVALDSDGDQGDGYSTEVMSDMLARASHEALRLWLATRQAVYEDELGDDGE